MLKLALSLSFMVLMLAACGAQPLPPARTTGTDAAPTPGQARTDGDVWEYYCLTSAKSTEIIKMSDRAGLQGWEMVAGTGLGATSTWCFKRLNSAARVDHAAPGPSDVE